MTERLKECPFCGKQPKLIKLRRNNYIYCDTPHSICPVLPMTRYWSSNNIKDTVKAWNRRA